MVGLASLAQDLDLRTHTHLAETVAETVLVHKLFPESHNYTDVYHSCGILRKNSVLAHAIYVSQEELATIKRSGNLDLFLINSLD